MYRYWARLESTLGKDLVAARGVWERLLKISGSVLEVWQGYIAMESEMGNINEARSLFKRCYSKRFPGTGSEDICNSWIRFEREYGELDNFDLAVKKVTPRLEELQLFKLQEAKNVSVSADDGDNSSRKNVREKRKPVSNLIEEQSPAKRHKDKAKNVKIISEDGEGHTKEPVKVNNKKPDVAASKSVSGSKKENKDVASGKPQQYNDQCTAFVSNLNLKATHDDIRRFFSDVGGVVAIRILTDKFTGKSRGLAYVDFSDDKHLAAAVAKNKQTLLGKRVSIAKSDPKGRKKGNAAPGTSLRQGDNADQTSESSKSDAKNSAEGSEDGFQPSSHHRASNIQLKGKNTFAMPRAVRPLGWVDKDKPKPKESDSVEDENPKSNDEFRKMFIKS
uniref:Squamous cell carcinoma antigen recognized by T-cells n=2 Tax=Solanum tuberosum TaxID=4113 RepID=M1BUX2_SOLTU